MSEIVGAAPGRPEAGICWRLATDSGFSLEKLGSKKTKTPDRPCASHQVDFAIHSPAIHLRGRVPQSAACAKKIKRNRSGVQEQAHSKSVQKAHHSLKNTPQRVAGASSARPCDDPTAA